jgi:hypothetical protein
METEISKASGRVPHGAGNVRMDAAQLRREQADHALIEDLARLSSRLRTSFVVVGEDAQRSVVELFQQAQVPLRDVPLEASREAAERASREDDVIAAAVSATQSIVFCPLRYAAYRVFVAAILPAPPETSRMLVDLARDVLRLKRDTGELRSQLSQVTAELDASCENQQWLRERSRGLSVACDQTSANAVAHSILGSTLELLRAENLYLLIEDQEMERSGLHSACFGQSPVSLGEMRDFFKEFRGDAPSLPVLVNQADFLRGRLRSLVAVPLRVQLVVVGYVLAVNRTCPAVAGPVSPTAGDFSHFDTTLLEEAAALLAAQTRNMSLILDSQQLVLGTLQAMSRAIDARDPYTQGHSERVARLAFELARILGLEESTCQEIYVAGILHDVGKIGMPDNVLLKPDSLTVEEFAVIKQHPEIGYRIIEQLGKLHFTLPGILYHHERWDGTGYPHGLGGEDIPLMARILAVADSFDAMTSSRPYRQAMPPSKAVAIMRSGAGTQWDANVVESFTKWHKDCAPTVPIVAAGCASFIPQEAPYADLTQSLLALHT